MIITFYSHKRMILLKIVMVTERKANQLISGKLHFREGLVYSEKFCKQHHGAVFSRNKSKA